jgi:hypothetical protein
MIITGAFFPQTHVGLVLEKELLVPPVLIFLTRQRPGRGGD